VREADTRRSTVLRLVFIPRLDVASCMCVREIKEKRPHAYCSSADCDMVRLASWGRGRGCGPRFFGPVFCVGG